MEKLLLLLVSQEYTIASCESLTGGLFMSEFTSVPNVSQVFKGGIVTYWNEIKEFAGVKKETLDQFGAVSKETAFEMAKGVQEKFQVNVAVSFTGNAGPAVMEGKPAGLVYSCILINDEEYDFCDLIEKSRNEVREEIVALTVNRLNELLGK